MLDLSDNETQRMIYITIMFGFAYLLAFVLYFGITKKPKEKTKRRN